jgi:hypothetical protein
MPERGLSDVYRDSLGADAAYRMVHAAFFVAEEGIEDGDWNFSDG